MKKRLMLLALTGFLLSGCGEPSNNEPINPPDENEDNEIIQISIQVMKKK